MLPAFMAQRAVAALTRECGAATPGDLTRRAQVRDGPRRKTWSPPSQAAEAVCRLGIIGWCQAREEILHPAQPSELVLGDQDQSSDARVFAPFANLLLFRSDVRSFLKAKRYSMSMSFF